MNEVVEQFRQLVDNIKVAQINIQNLQSELDIQEEKNHKLEFIQKLNFLRNMDHISKLEYTTVIEMLISPDVQNHYMAKQIVKTKIESSNWEMAMINLYE